MVAMVIPTFYAGGSLPEFIALTSEGAVSVEAYAAIGARVRVSFAFIGV